MRFAASTAALRLATISDGTMATPASDNALKRDISSRGQTPAELASGIGVGVTSARHSQAMLRNAASPAREPDRYAMPAGSSSLLIAALTPFPTELLMRTMRLSVCTARHALA